MFNRTLDILSSIDLTFESLDPTSLIYYDDNDDDNTNDHVWILLRSTSNTLQAWDQATCQLHGTICLNSLVERIGRTDEQLASMRQTATLATRTDSSANECIRITSFLIHEDQLWIGTSTGIIYVFTFVFQRKLNRTCAINPLNRRSYSVTSQMMKSPDETSRILLSNDGTCRQRDRSRSDSAMIDLSNTSDEYLTMDYSHYRLAFPMKACRRSSLFCRRQHSIVNPSRVTKKHLFDRDSTDSSSTLASAKTRSSSPAVISTDEYCPRRPSSRLPLTTVHEQKPLEPTSTLIFNLIFKAKIADAPVKCICKTKYEQISPVDSCARFCTRASFDLVVKDND
jgi:hypothetical protein